MYEGLGYRLLPCGFSLPDTIVYIDSSWKASLLVIGKRFQELITWVIGPLLSLSHHYDPLIIIISL